VTAGVIAKRTNEHLNCRTHGVDPHSVMKSGTRVEHKEVKKMQPVKTYECFMRISRRDML